MKTKSDKRVNRQLKHINKQIKDDVFEGRFTVRQILKYGYIDSREYHGYLLEFQDAKCPERNYRECFSEGELLIGQKAWLAMNDFVITSDFWSTFDRSYFKGKDMCYVCKNYKDYTIHKERIKFQNVKTGMIVDILGEMAYCKKCKNKMIDEKCVLIRNREKLKAVLLEMKINYEIYDWVIK